jgi:hypothetical protein
LPLFHNSFMIGMFADLQTQCLPRSPGWTPQPHHHRPLGGAQADHDPRVQGVPEAGRCQR